VIRAESTLLPAFDSWRTGGLSDLAPIGVTKGSFDWLVQEFKKQQKWKDVDLHTKRTYEQGTKLFADHILKDGSRAGSKQVGDFTKAFVDAVYTLRRMLNRTLILITSAASLPTHQPVCVVR
jgi:hypothetical protein